MPPVTLNGMGQLDEEFAAITRIQDRAIGEARDVIRSTIAAGDATPGLTPKPGRHPGGSILIEAPVGAGKTRIMARNIANFTEDFRREHGRDPYIVVFAHREKLISQGRDELALWAPEARLRSSMSSSFPTAENPKGGLDQSGDVNFCTVQTAAANLTEMRKPDLIYVDEVHHASDAEGADYTKAIARAIELNPRALIIGTTATPGRPDRKGLNPVFNGAAHITIGRKELERARQINLPITKQVTIHGDDGRTVNSIMRSEFRPEKDAESAGLAKKILAARPKDYNDQMLNAWEREYRDPMAKRGLQAGTLVYETNTKTAEAFYKDAKERGIRVALVDSKQSVDDNRAALKDIEAGRIEMVVSVKMIDEGVNLPRTRSIIINRATTSATEYDQMNGRAQRTGRDPELRDVKPIVLDGGASTMIHGSVERQASIADYYQRLARGEVREEIDNDRIRMPDVEGGYEPWKLSKDPPPVMFLTDGKSNIYAVPQAAPDGRMLYALSEAQVVKGKAEVRIMRGADGKPMINVDAMRLRHIEAERILPAKYDLLRLEATESRNYPGRTLADERMLSATKEAETALDFAMRMRGAGVGAGR